MRFDKGRRALAFSLIPSAFSILALAASPSSLAGPPPGPLHGQRYAMGTMFDIIVYHSAHTEAERAIGSALDEIERLDSVLSHYRVDSDLAILVRDGRRRQVTVVPDLYDVVERSLAFSRRSGGKFDVTIAPLLTLWKRARAEGRRPSTRDIAAARHCVGYENIELRPPNTIRLHSECLDIDLGGIGKGYAVDRALAVLESRGVRHAVVNAGGSSIASIGTPPGGSGWIVRLGAAASGAPTITLRDRALATSQQNPAPLAFDIGPSADILDPHSGAPAAGRDAITVVAPDATTADALSTTLLVMAPEEGRALLDGYPGVAAYRVGEGGRVAVMSGDTPRGHSSGQ